MNKHIELLYKQWNKSTEDSEKAQELYRLFCNTGDKANDDMNFTIIAKAVSEESKIVFCAGFHTAMSILIENNRL